MSHSLTDIVILWNGCAVGILFLFSASQESAGSDWPHWSAIICMLNTPMAPWCWRGTLSCKVQSAQVTLRSNTHRCTRSHSDTHTMGASVIQCPVLCLHFGLLMRRVVSGILSGLSDLSVVVQPSSPFDSQEKDWTAVVLMQHSLLARPVHFFVLLIPFKALLQFRSV